MEPANHTDPLEEALSHGSQRVAQLASLVGATAQVIWQRRALASARAAAGSDQQTLRVIADQERALHQQARLTWAPALDPQWLARADLLQVARAWASAVASADTDPSADLARRRCEDKLRDLHPYAMAHYDRLRTDGADPLEAMRETAPLFAYSPTTRTGDPSPTRQALKGDTAPNVATGYKPPGPDQQPSADEVDPAELRGQQIVERLQGRARANGQPDLAPDELTVLLETATNLPTDVINRLTESAPASAARVPATGDVAPSAAQLAAQSFPRSAAEAVRSASKSRTQTTAGLRRTLAPHKAKRQSRSL